MTPGAFEPITTASSGPAGTGVQGWLLRIARAASWSGPAAAGHAPVVPLTVAGKAGPVVKQTLPVTVVPGAVLVKVLETMPKGASLPRLGAVCAATGRPSKVTMRNNTRSRIDFVRFMRISICQQVHDSR